MVFGDAADDGEQRTTDRARVLILAAVAMAIDGQLRDSPNLLVAIALLTAFTCGSSVARPRWLQGRTLIFLGRISSSFYFVQFAVLGWIGSLVPQGDGRHRRCAGRDCRDCRDDPRYRGQRCN